MGIEFKINITAEILSLIARIDGFRGAWTYYQGLTPDFMNQLKKVASIESVGSSTRIEGSKLNDAEVEAILSGLDIRAFKTRDEQEVAGYVYVQKLVFDSYLEINFNENTIKQLHRDLLKFSSKDERHRGEYKKFPNNVEAFDEGGKSLGVIFKTASAFETPNKMKDLLSWFNQELDKKELHYLLLISIFIVHFLAIHPFQDGNGRLSRVLTNLLLLRAGYEFVPFSSLEKIIEDNKEEYYKALRLSQKDLESKLNFWIVFFLKSLDAQILSLSKKLENQKIIKPLSPLSTKIIDLAKFEPKITVRAIVALTNSNRNTVKAHIKALVVQGYLNQHGVGKGTYYSLNSSKL